MILLDILSEGTCLLHLNKRIGSLARHCSLGSRLALHAQENHLFIAYTFDFLTSKYATDVVLDCLCCLVLGLLLSWLLHFTVTQSLGVLGRFLQRIELLEGVKVTTTALPTSLILLNQSDGGTNLKVVSRWIQRDLLNRLR